MMRSVPVPPHAARRRAVLGWSLYDLANTIFFLLVVTLYLPKQMAQITGDERAVAWSYVPTMLVAAFLSPALGAFVDRAGRARTLTFAITCLCCAATALLGWQKTALALSLVYAFARFTYEMASVPYNALLPTVAAQAGLGGISGLGVALGYLGNIVALALLRFFGLEDRGYAAVYGFTAGLFLAFTLPLQWWVREPPAAAPAPWRWGDLAAATLDTLRALKRQFRQPARRGYYLGTLLVCDAVNTVLVQLGRYAQREEGLGLSDDDVKTFLMAVQISAIAGGLMLGRLADRFTGRRVTLASVALLSLGIVTAQFLPGFWLRTVAMSVLGGAGLAGVWAAGRKWLVDLVPPAEIGEACGFYGLAQRASVVTLFPFTALFEATGSYDMPVLLLLALLAAGFELLRRTPARGS
jgi:UMF1 family MFS transporter